MDLIDSIDRLDFDDPTWTADPVEWTAVRALFQRQYWRRLWTVAEVLLSQDATVLCGWKQTPISSFVKFQQAIAYYAGLSDARYKAMQIGDTPYTLILSEWHSLRKMIKQDGIPISQLLTTTGRFDCYLPIDKIFAILSISTQIDREVIKIDYSLCFRCIMTRVAKYTFIRREATSPLTFLQTHQRDKDPCLPSWVPDYSRHDTEWHLLVPDNDECTPYRAGATNADWNAIGAERLIQVNKSDNSAKLQVEGRGLSEALLLEGLIVGTISKAMPAPFIDLYTGSDPEEDARTKRERRDKTRDVCREWEQQAVGQTYDKDPYRKTGSRYDAFWRTVIGDRDLSWRGPPHIGRDYAQRFEAWMGRGERAHDEDFVRAYSHAAIIRTIYRSFLLLDDGHMGLGRSDVRQGDVVVVLRGGDVPFILRPRGSTGCYTFMGEAYVHGIMDGSCVRKAKKGSVTRFHVC